MRASKGGTVSALVAALALALSAVACTGGDEQRTLSSGPSAPGPVLTVLERDEVVGKLALRSPTFRCASDYCGGAVILGMRAILGAESFQWGTEIVEGEPFVELRIRFDPARYNATQVRDAVIGAMGRYPDPNYSAPWR